MRNPAKGNAACWDCGWYLVLDGRPLCVRTDHEKPLPVMPMKCEFQEKPRKAQ